MMFAMTEALADGHEPLHFEPRPRRKPSPKSPPKDAREFHFSKIGEVFAEKNERTIFSCIARNEENARRKFNKGRNICYKTDRPCRYDCSGLCRDSY